MNPNQINLVIIWLSVQILKLEYRSAILTLSGNNLVVNSQQILTLVLEHQLFDRAVVGIRKILSVGQVLLLIISLYWVTSYDILLVAIFQIFYFLLIERHRHWYFKLVILENFNRVNSNLSKN